MRTLYYSQDMEAFAMDLRRIQKACDEAGCKVEFKVMQAGFTVCFYRKMHPKDELSSFYDAVHDTAQVYRINNFNQKNERSFEKERV